MSNKLSRLPRSIRDKIGLVVFCLILAATSQSTLSLQPSDKNETATAKKREEQLKEVKQRLGWITVSLGNNATKQSSRDQPLLRFNDPARLFHDGSLWAFGEKGRPVMLMALERYESNWAWELIALSSDKLTASLVDGWNWAPAKTALELRELPNAGTTPESDAARLSQMKSLIRRFAAAESSHDGQRFELRLLPQPLLRYSDPEAKIIDGAMFAFVYGTNPEVIAVIEYYNSNEGASRWRYGLVPLTTAKASASLDGKEVWSKSATPVPKQQDPYTYLADPISKNTD